ncbi:hypothetical protein [Flagellimonas sp.]|uniref:hypothetical protein n=1 Tax=Flagellimonas sp. TaxID=2058762 RepID=UPI003B5058DA
MNKKGVFALCAMLLLAVFIIANRSNKVDWTPTFDENGTKPLDTKVFFDQLPAWFNGKSTKKIHTTFYEYDQYLRLQPVDSLKNYISISSNYHIDETSFEALLEYVAYGNNAFISAHSFPYFMKDTLAFETTYHPIDLEEKTTTLFLNYAQDSLKYLSKIQLGKAYVKDTTTVKKLGYLSVDGEKQLTNFVGIPFYDGIFYIHTTPEVFTNYQMLNVDDVNYLNAVVSYLPNVPILLDKAIKIDAEVDQSPLRFITSRESLRWAWYLLLLAIGLFLIFNAKRRQRIVPIILPLKNTTTEFVHTVSNLHYEAEDYNGVIQKMIIHFLEFVRSNYHLSTEHLNQDFIKKLALKSGRPLEQVQALVLLISKMRTHNFKTKEPLIKLNKAIEKFYNND